MCWRGFGPRGANSLSTVGQERRFLRGVQFLCAHSDFLKEDSPKDNILTEKVAKKIHEAGNCELHEVQQRTDKVQRQRCYSYIEAGFQVCPCGGKLIMPEEMLSCIRQKFKQLIEDAYITLQSTRGAKHAWCSAMAEAPFPCQRVDEKDQQKRNKIVDS